MLKKVSFAFAILGIGVLLGMLALPAKEFGSIDDLRENEKVFVEGKVENEKDFGDFKILKVNGTEIYCSCKDSYLGEEVYVEGYVDEFDGKKQIRVLKIREFG